jgi:hypothetical protein
VLGPNVAAFEQEYALHTGTAHSVGVASGLSALELCLEVLGIGPGDEVLAPSNTYIATILAISHRGATPVLVEPNPATANIDASRVAAAITERTKALLVVHLFGQSCEMGPLANLATAHGLKLIEDNAQAHGAAWEGRRTGSWGQASATSFCPAKNLGALGEVRVGPALSAPSSAMCSLSTGRRREHRRRGHRSESRQPAQLWHQIQVRGCFHSLPAKWFEAALRPAGTATCSKVATSGCTRCRPLSSASSCAASTPTRRRGSASPPPTRRASRSSQRAASSRSPSSLSARPTCITSMSCARSRATRCKLTSRHAALLRACITLLPRICSRATPASSAAAAHSRSRKSWRPPRSRCHSGRA